MRVITALSKKRSLRPVDIIEGNFKLGDIDIMDLVDELCEYLGYNKVPKKVLSEYRLLFEEILIKISEKISQDTPISYRISRRNRTIHVTFSYDGEKINAYPENSSDYGGKILEDYAECLSISQFNNRTSITLSYGTYNHYDFRLNLIAMGLGVATAGLLHLFLKEGQYAQLYQQFILPILELFSRTLRMLSGPIVFLSIFSTVTSITLAIRRNASLIKIISKYYTSSIICIMFSFLSVFLLKDRMSPLEENFLTERVEAFGNTLKDIIYNVMPDNLITAFTSASPVPIILTSLLLGITACSFKEKETEEIIHNVSMVNKLFSTVLSKVYNLIPIFLYISEIDNTIYTVTHNENSFFSGIILAPIITILLILLYYSAKLIRAGINPIAFLKENRELLITNFRIGSSEDAIPYNVRKFSSKYNVKRETLFEQFRLGSSLNLDGTCSLTAIFITIICILCKYPLDLQTVIIIAVFILLLAPGQNGGVLITMLVLYDYLGISTDFVQDIILVDAFYSIVFNFINVFSDIVFISITNKDYLKEEYKVQEIH